MKKQKFIKLLRNHINKQYPEHAPSVTSKYLNEAYIWASGFYAASIQSAEQPISMQEVEQFTFEQSITFLISCLDGKN